MIAPFANLFGYILNFIYNIVNNYGLAIIIFSILIKIILLPLSIKQQKTMKKTTKIQNKLKEIQFKYKNDPENLNRATMELYKTENMSPFSGCFSGIVQIILLFAVFYLVRSPLTYMKKIDANIINKYKNYFGKSRVVVIKSQLGQPITAYSGDEVYWSVPKKLPKMTKLMIDGKALYIHRANYQIIDTSLLN